MNLLPSKSTLLDILQDGSALMAIVSFVGFVLMLLGEWA